MSNFASDQINAFLTKKLYQNLMLECNNATQVVVKQNSIAGADDGGIVMVVSSDLTLDITVSGDTGLDIGSEAADTWYYVWLIWRPDTEAVSGILSVSPTAPTLPSGYTKKRLIGAAYNDSSSNFRFFVQRGADVLYRDYLNIANTYSTNWIQYTLSSFIPANASKLKSLGGAWYQGAIAMAYLYYSPFAEAGAGSGGIPMAFTRNNSTEGYCLAELTTVVTSAQIISLYGQAGGSVQGYELKAIGFEMNL